MRQTTWALRGRQLQEAWRILASFHSAWRDPGRLESAALKGLGRLGRAELFGGGPRAQSLWRQPEVAEAIGRRGRLPLQNPLSRSSSDRTDRNLQD